MQFVGIPFTLMFGSIPGDAGGHERRRAVFVAFVVFNLVALPLVGMLGGRALAADLVGRSRPDFPATATAVGQGEYEVTDAGVSLDGAWGVVPRDDLGRGASSDYAFTARAGRRGVAAASTGARSRSPTPGGPTTACSPCSSTAPRPSTRTTSR